MAYNILQMLPTIRIKLIHNFRLANRPAGVWSSPVCHDAYTLDFCSWKGHRIQVLSSKGTTSFRRALYSWQWTAPGTRYCHMESKPDVAREGLWLQFYLEGSLPPLTGRPYFFIMDKHQEFARRVKTMYSVQQNSGPGSGLVLHGMLTTILGGIIGAAHRKGNGSLEQPFVLTRSPELMRADNSLLTQVDNIVVENLADPLSVDEIAEQLNLSTSSLSHRFRAEAGMTVVERIRWLRIREARLLLIQPNADVKSVARKLGFSSPFYFSRVFREITGMPPQTFINHHSGI